MLTASYKKHILEFKTPSGTSRGILRFRETWFLILEDNGKKGIGECGYLEGLSYDDPLNYHEKLNWVCQNIKLGPDSLYEATHDFPSIQFGIETAFKSLESDNSFEIFPSDFSLGKKSIPINGLIWMGDKTFMNNQINEKIKQGFRCIKMKIGAIDFQTEIELLKNLRKEYSMADIELRVDANGAFTYSEALEKLKILSEFNLHSIEQPIKPGNWEEMAKLCDDSPLPIALDEELIGVFQKSEKERLLDQVRPQYIILKPSLIGGFRGSDEWISIAGKKDVGWWFTSALESNVGLNAISQFSFIKNSKLPQGLGTGHLFINNISSPLNVQEGNLHYNPNELWKLNTLNETV